MVYDLRVATLVAFHIQDGHCLKASTGKIKLNCCCCSYSSFHKA